MKGILIDIIKSICRLCGARSLPGNQLAFFTLAAVISGIWLTPLSAQSPGENADNLRKAAQNPVASLISVPIEETWNFGIGPENRVQNILKVQPVIPVDLSQNWNLIIRWINPVIWQPIPSAAEGGYYGLGDMNPEFFVSPKVSKVIWGVGPAFALPTATNGFVGQKKFSVGPDAVLLVQPGKWTLGALVQNVWSVAGPSDRPDVNEMLLQYFINYNLPKGWYLSWQPKVTANWEVESGERWVVPFGGGVGRIMRFGAQPVNITGQIYGNAVHPTGAASWSFRMQIALLFPK